MTNVAEQRLRLPPGGTSREELRREMDEASANDAKWLERLAAGTNYPAGDDVLEVAKEAYLRFFSTNGLLPSHVPEPRPVRARGHRLRRGAAPRPRRGREHHLGRLGDRS